MAPPVANAPIASPPSPLAPPSPALPPPPPPRELLRIAREDRKEIALQVGAGRIEGFARGAGVSLVVGARELRGAIGAASVQLWLRAPWGGDTLVEGTIDGRETGFRLQPTDRGQLLQGAIPGHTVRLELGRELLSFYPGCDAELRAVDPGVYQGACAGRKIRVALPAAFARLPAAQQLVVLAVLLTETDPVFKYATPRLFPSD